MYTEARIQGIVPETVFLILYWWWRSCICLFKLSQGQRLRICICVFEHSQGQRLRICICVFEHSQGQKRRSVPET